MLVETAVRMKFFQTTATHEPQKLMLGHIINITSSTHTQKSHKNLVAITKIKED